MLDMGIEGELLCGERLQLIRDDERYEGTLVRGGMRLGGPSPTKTPRFRVENKPC